MNENSLRIGCINGWYPPLQEGLDKDRCGGMRTGKALKIAEKVVWEESESWILKPKYRDDCKCRVGRSPEFMDLHITSCTVDIIFVRQRLLR